jgi:ABC-2 type transport system permease protein/oleandomycin transport system permease protein
MARDASLARTRHRNGWLRAITDTWVLTKRQLVRIPRVPELIAFATFQPLSFLLLFRYVFGGAIDTSGPSYVNYMMAGILIQTAVIGASATCTGMAEDMLGNLAERLRSLPCWRPAFLLGRVAADTVRNLIVTLFLLGAGWLIGFRPACDLKEGVAAVGLILLVGFAFSWVGVVMGLVSRSAEAAQSMGMAWVFPLTFLSSAFVPTATMPTWLRLFADHQPMTWLIDAERKLLLHQPALSSLRPAVIVCILVLLVFVPLSVVLYERKSRTSAARL